MNPREKALPWTRTQIIKRPLPHLKGQLLTRCFTRSVLLWKRRTILDIQGAEHIAADHDPFILVANHSQRTEAVLLPAILFFLRNGRRVHFMADWNFCLIPPVAFLYWCGEVILLTRKPAKPLFLNALKPLFTRKETGFERARRMLEEGRCVGVFPEGTTNRHPKRLLKGYSGAAQLALKTGVTVVPTGLYFPDHTGIRAITESAPVQVRFGRPLHPVNRIENPTLEEVRSFHEKMMTEISRLCGKSWQPKSQRK